MRAKHSLVAAVPLALLLVLVTAATAFAGQPPVNLGSSASYGLLAYRGITNAGSTSVIGDLGVGLNNPPGAGISVSGSSQIGNPAATQALLDLDAAIKDASARTPYTILTSSGGDGNLGGRTLLPGVYRNHGTEPGLSLNGTLTLDAQGDPDAVWVFQSVGDRTLETGQGSRIVLVNGARFCRVFWQAGTVMLGADSTFVGHVLANDWIQVAGGAKVRGQLMALGNVEAGGTIDLAANQIDNSGYACPTPSVTPRLPKTGYPPQERTATPWPLAVGALAAFAIGMWGFRRRAARRRAR